MFARGAIVNFDLQRRQPANDVDDQRLLELCAQWANGAGCAFLASHISLGGHVSRHRRRARRSRGALLRDAAISIPTEMVRAMYDLSQPNEGPGECCKCLALASIHGVLL